LLTGSLVTRSGSSLACPAFPHCGLAAVPDALERFVTIQMLHRYTAFAVTALVLVLLSKLRRQAPDEPGQRWFGAILLALLVLQFALGISNVLLALPMWSRTLHLATAALIWVATVMLWVVTARERAL
jgi:cytochrome c oxidase assembly protein subunit 15